MKTKFLPLALAAFMALAMFGNTTYASENRKEKDSPNMETYYIGGLKKGNLMLWDITSQCSNTFSVTIKDDDQTYVEINKNNYVKELNLLSHEAAIYEGGSNLRIEVVFDNENVQIKTANASGSIRNEKGKSIGCIYNYSLEDGNDSDYNDAVISLTSWKKNG